MERDEILDYLPHRPPFLWIDRVLAIQPGLRCTAAKRVDPGEPLLAGHFPDDPILPGVLIIEAAAQTAAVMFGAAAGGAAAGRPHRLAAVNYFKFLRAVRPGCELIIEVWKATEAGPMVCVEAVVRVDGEVVAKGALSVVA